MPWQEVSIMYEGVVPRFAGGRIPPNGDLCVTTRMVCSGAVTRLSLTWTARLLDSRFRGNDGVGMEMAEQCQRRLGNPLYLWQVGDDAGFVAALEE